MKTLEKLSKWYHAQCNGEWEHSFGMKIKTLDNPGWFVRINLAGTPLAGENLILHTFNSKTEESPNENDWIHVEIKENQFQGAGGPDKLEEILECFLQWAEKSNKITCASLLSKT